MLHIIILAAGKGTRMKSHRAKVLHPIGGVAMVNHVVQAAINLSPASITVVVGHQAEVVGNHLRTDFPTAPLHCVLQEEQLGTAHAVSLCLPLLRTLTQNKPNSRALILYGDVPLVCAHTLQSALIRAEKEQCEFVLTAKIEDPTGYGRIIRATEKGQPSELIDSIVEQKHLDDKNKSIQEINTGVIIVDTNSLYKYIDKIEQSSVGEYYLTDIVSLKSHDKTPFKAFVVPNFQAFMGINDRLQLAVAEREYQKMKAEQLMLAGTHIADPSRVTIRGEVKVGQDVFLDVGVVLIGAVVLGNGVRVGAYSVLENVGVGDGTLIEPFSHLVGSEIGQNAKIGPFARLRPGTHLADEVHVGNFVELKNSQVGKSSKINHLSYVGDADVGARVNVGAGTITCNYDGVNKFRTTIEDDVFIGSDTQLIAPVTVEKGATLGAGTTLTQNAPAHQLTLSRVPQKSLPHWQRPKKAPSK